MLKPTRREAFKTALAVTALAALPAMAKPKLIGVKTLVMTSPGDPRGGYMLTEWLPISWKRLRPGDVVKFADEPNKEYRLKSEMYHRDSDGAETVDLDPIPDGMVPWTRRITPEYLETLFGNGKSKEVEVPARYWSREENCFKGRRIWFPRKLELLVDNQLFRWHKFPNHTYRLFTL